MPTGVRTIAWLRHAAITAVAAGALALPLRSAAHAGEQIPAKGWQHPPAPAATNAWAGTSFEQRCRWPYRNQFPPCMSTWPEGDPNYHGSRPGTTFTR